MTPIIEDLEPKALPAAAVFSPEQCHLLYRLVVLQMEALEALGGGGEQFRERISAEVVRYRELAKELWTMAGEN